MSESINDYFCFNSLTVGAIISPIETIEKCDNVTSDFYVDFTGRWAGYYCPPCRSAFELVDNVLMSEQNTNDGLQSADTP